MATYTKNGMRKYKVESQKDALKQLNSFGDILQRMNNLDLLIEGYDGQITQSTKKIVADELNREHKLKLTDSQIDIVLKKYEE